MQILLASMIAFGVLLIFAAVARSVGAPTRLTTVTQQYSRPYSLEEIQLSEPFYQRAIRPGLRALARLLSRLTPGQLLEATRQKLDLAGNPGDMPAVEFLGLRGLAAVLTGLALAIISNLMHATSPVVILLIFASIPLGFYLPLLWLNQMIHKRQEDIQLALPDALDLLTVCAEAGMGLDGAMQQVVDKWDNHLSRAFKRVLTEIRLGKVRSGALRDMATRAQVRDLTNFVAALLQAEQHGSPIAHVLRSQSEQMRVLRRQRAQERANQMPIKLLFPLMFLIFPSMFIVILGPAMLRLMKGFL